MTQVTYLLQFLILNGDIHKKKGFYMAEAVSSVVTNKVFAALTLTAAIILAGLSGLAWWAHVFTTSMVRTELSAQKIYFPNKEALADYPTLQQYAGQLVDDGPKAKAYANEYIGAHLKDAAGGKTYSEVSTDARKDPSNAELQKQKQTLFQGETLRGMLLGNGYAFWTIGAVARITAICLLVASALSFLAFLMIVTKVRSA